MLGAIVYLLWHILTNQRKGLVFPYSTLKACLFYLPSTFLSDQNHTLNTYNCTSDWWGILSHKLTCPTMITNVLCKKFLDILLCKTPHQTYEKSKLSSDLWLNAMVTIEYLAFLPRSHKIAFTWSGLKSLFMTWCTNISETKRQMFLATEKGKRHHRAHSTR